VRRLDAARRAGRDAGRNLARAGLGVNLAPVLDVSRSPAGFIARDGRSYGRGPNTVGRLASAFIGAQQAVGVAATAKHFPGLGAAGPSEDTDRRPVTLRVPAPTLRAVDELPYRRAIAGSVRLVMVSWAVYPALDPARPAGLSPAVVEGELRGRLGFTGVTITDALAAGALRESGDASARAVAAAGAGMDLLLCASGDAGEGAMAAGGLATALRDGRLDPGTARDAVSRILALRRDLPG
jgi:beta-N-acetylhexosaminidase